MCLSYPNCETGHRLVRGVYALITALGLGFNRVLRLSSSLMQLDFLPMVQVLPLPTLMSLYVIIPTKAGCSSREVWRSLRHLSIQTPFPRSRI